jgi:hypothetical protein
MVYELFGPSGIFFPRFYQSTKYFPGSILRANTVPKIFHSNLLDIKESTTWSVIRRILVTCLLVCVVEYYAYPPFLVPRCSFCGSFSYDKDAVT